MIAWSLFFHQKHFFRDIDKTTLKSFTCCAYLHAIEICESMQALVEGELVGMREFRNHEKCAWKVAE